MEKERVLVYTGREPVYTKTVHKNIEREFVYTRRECQNVDGVDIIRGLSIYVNACIQKCSGRRFSHAKRYDAFPIFK